MEKYQNKENFTLKNKKVNIKSVAIFLCINILHGL
jgi:hypothetical protein